MESASRKVVGHAETRPSPDLVHLALILAGATRVSETLQKALRALQRAGPETHWGIFERKASATYAVTASPDLDGRRLRDLLTKVCGPRARLRTTEIHSRRLHLAGPRFHCVPEDATQRDIEPELVVAVWCEAGVPLPASPSVASAARLIAGALRSARMLEFLIEQSSKDPLTGVLNRRGILDVLDRETGRARRHGRPLAVLFADLDEFKKTNDRHGHRAGDEVLSGVARILVGALRSSDSVGRFGGDEFVIVLPDTDLELARRIGDRLCREIGSAPLRTSAGELHASLTVGAASLAEPAAGQALVERADLRMLERKKLRSKAFAAARSLLVPEEPVPGLVRGS